MSEACVVCLLPFDAQKRGAHCPACRGAFACAGCLEAWSQAVRRRMRCPICRRDEGPLTTPGSPPLLVACHFVFLCCYVLVRFYLFFAAMQGSPSWTNRSFASAVLFMATTVAAAI